MWYSLDMELHLDKAIKISTADSRDPSLVKIQLFRNYTVGAKVVRQLIDQSRHPETPEPDLFEFAGHHGGMPKQFVWAMSRNGQEASVYLPEIIARVQEALAVAETPAPQEG